MICILVACTGNSDNNGGGPPNPNEVCSNTCQYHNDGQCDDGAPGADTADCAYGTDCADCGPRPVTATACTCDTTNACDQGCTCDPQCGTKALGSPCSCSDGSDVCANTACASQYCLWGGGSAGYCTQACGTCPSGFGCTDIVGLGSYCTKVATVSNCGTCTDSSDCLPFQFSGYSVTAACFNGRCRERCDASSPCNCISATPMGGDAVGYCADDGC